MTWGIAERQDICALLTGWAVDKRMKIVVDQ